MEVEYVIVQAGGKGSRMGHLTRNKPKALVPVGPRPMLFHLFEKFPEKKFLVIGDYQYDVLDRYLRTFAKVNYEMIDGRGGKGTCAGLGRALELIPPGKPFMLIWCDLVLPNPFPIPEMSANYIGISKGFTCRWSWDDNSFCENPSCEHGVAGLFLFKEKAELQSVPANGEFVRWLSETEITFSELPLNQTQEYGLLQEWEKIPTQKCRPFNRITVEDGRIRKEGIDKQGRELAVREAAWYQKINGQNFSNIPAIFSYDPLIMEYIKGKNVYEYHDLTHAEKRRILEQLVACLCAVQDLESAPADRSSFDNAYIGKTFDRLEKVWDLVPFGREKTMIVNGRKCRNVLYHKDALAAKIGKYYPDRFRLLHGDCTFSNILLREDGTPVLIDPRGYFGFTQFFGDPAYDWGKLYYSVVGNYDQFNLKRFSLDITDKEVNLKIASNGWEDMEQDLFELLDGRVDQEQIKLIHAIIWLSLTTYAWQDYDSICGAFYNGLYYLEDVL